MESNAIVVLGAHFHVTKKVSRRVVVFNLLGDDDGLRVGF